MAGFIIFPKISSFIEKDNVKISITKKEQANGLMGVDNPSFMVFLYKEACSPRFWMKNTPQPLDIIFCNDDLVISSIRKGEPFDKSLIDPTMPCKAVIEAPFGFCKSSGIDLGDKVKIKYDKGILEKILKTWS